MRFKIVHDRKECIGCGSCISVCGSSWEMGSDNKSDLKESSKIGGKEILELDGLGCNMQAAEICPVNCIHIFENGKKKI